MFDNCEDMGDIPVEGLTHNHSDTDFSEIPTVLGKKRHREIIQQDNTIIIISDEDEDEKFMPKRQHMASHESQDTHRHVQYSSPLLSKAHLLYG